MLSGCDEVTSAVPLRDLRAHEGIPNCQSRGLHLPRIIGDGAMVEDSGTEV
jgi:hypothetical protein